MIDYFYDLEDNNYYNVQNEASGNYIYLCNMNTYKKDFILILESTELVRRIIQKEIRKLNKQEEAKLKLLFGVENEAW